LGNAKYHRSYLGPNAGTRAHGTRLVRGIQHEIRQIPTIAGGNIFQGFKLHMLMDEPEVFTRLPADAITTSRFPITRVMTAPME